MITLKGLEINQRSCQGMGHFRLMVVVFVEALITVTDLAQRMLVRPVAAVVIMLSYAAF